VKGGFLSATYFFTTILRFRIFYNNFWSCSNWEICLGFLNLSR